MIWNKNLHWFLCLLFLTSCARQSSPTGGPKDTIPPVLKAALPPDGAINFKGKELELLFSEDIILNTPKEQLIITPAIGKEYEIKARNNTVSIAFGQALQDSTTYTFNFRESVQDITEKNPVKNLQVAFSTGNYIDSLSIEGSVFDLLKGKVIAEATVALHGENDTFSILKHPAVFFTKTDKKGKFKISHLKPSNYFTYGFDDKNRNLIVDSRTEAYGFIQENIYLIENLKDLQVGLIRLDARPLKMTSARPYNTYYNIRMAKNIRTFQVSTPDSSELSYTFGEDNANIRVYKNFDQDSLQIRLVASDSIDNKVDTTLYVKFLTREVTPEKFELSLATSSLISEKGQLSATVIFNKPLKEINFDSIYFQIDSLQKISFNFKDLTYEPLSRKMIISKKVDKSLFATTEISEGSTPTNAPKLPDPKAKPNKPPLNQFYLGQSAFISIENDSSKKITETIKPLKEADLSILNIEIKTKEKFYLVELLDNAFKIVRVEKNKPKLRFEDLLPGEYQIRLIIDTNQNGRWDPGNYFNKKEAEKIIYFRGADGSTIIKGVKANWDIGAGEMFITY